MPPPFCCLSGPNFQREGEKMKFTIVFGLVTIFTIRVMRHKNMVKIGVDPLQNKPIYAA